MRIDFPGRPIFIQLPPVRDEMAAFFDVVNAKEFRHIEQKYPSARTVLGKLAEKVDQIDRVAIQ